MKGYLFVPSHCEDAVFWLTQNGSVSHKYHPSLIGCVSLDVNNEPKLLINMLLNTPPEKGKFTAEWLNSIG